jgi:branched-chain amino acid transport system permease protein
VILQYVLSGLAVGCVYGLVALGFVITYQGARFFNFAHGELYMLGAMLTFALAGSGRMPTLVAVVVGGLVVGLVAATTEVLVFRRFVVTGAPPINAIIASIGLAALFRGLAQLQWGPDSYSLPNVLGGPPVSIFGAIVQRDLVVLMVATVVLSALVYELYRHTRLGVAIRATAERIRMVGIFGVEIRRVLPLVFALAGVLAGIGGGLVAPTFKAQVFIGTTVLIKGFAAAILGGLSNTWGALAGGLALGVAESFGSRWFGATWVDIFAFTIVLVMLTVRPTGLLGRTTLEKV